MYLRIQNLSKSFGGQEVLKSISFTVSGRERVALVGQNGSGKSTLFKLIMGEETPDSGQVVLQPADASIGYLPQVLDTGLALSSGQKLKNAFRDLLITKPDMLILDEPTNHLDTSGLAWLKQAAASFPGPVLFVSHDRHFLDAVASSTIELHLGNVKVYGGNYTAYKHYKHLEQESYLRSYEIQQAHITKLKKDLAVKRETIKQGRASAKPTRDNDKFAASFFANRIGRKFGKQVQALEHRLEQLHQLDKPLSDPLLTAWFKPALEPGQTIVSEPIIITRGQRVALVGDNGSGKTTLIKQILSDPTNLGTNVTVGYLSQEHQELSSDRLVIDELASHHIDKTDSYKLLRRFLLPAGKINQPVNLLSSGEKAKLLLAKIMTNGSNFIILDEPTNHLDIPSREAIEAAIANYPGTLLVVSHDQYFLERIRITHYLQLPI